MKKKMSFGDLLAIGDYYAFSQACVDGVRGTIYKMCKPLSDEQKEEISRWKNTKLFIAQSQYAPELKRTAVFIGDKCFK